VAGSVGLYGASREVWSSSEAGFEGICGLVATRQIITSLQDLALCEACFDWCGPCDHEWMEIFTFTPWVQEAMVFIKTSALYFLCPILSGVLSVQIV